MIPIPVLSILHYNRPDLLRRCVRSLASYPIEKLVIVQNGPDELWPDDLPRPFVHIRLPNYGVAAATNLIVKTFPAPWWLGASNDIEFQPGDLENIAACSENYKDEAAMIVGNHAAAFGVMTCRGVQNVGLFDENFYPFYMEDYDWFYRAKLAGEPIIQAQGVNAIHGENGKPSSTIGADPVIASKSQVSFSHNCQYYRQKWGGDWGKETYTRPYNLPVPLDYWHFMPELRKLQQW